MEILDKLAQEIFFQRAYPDKHQIQAVVSKLVSKHPCLTEPGGGTGYDGCTKSIKYKLGNYRSLRDEDVDARRFSLKKPKQGEVNHIHDHPENYDDEEKRWTSHSPLGEKRLWNVAIHY